MDILSYTFMQRAFLAGVIVALMCPLIGMFIVIKRQSMLGDGLGHIAFAGVTGASLLKVYPPLGAIVLTVTSALGIELVRRYQKQYADMIMALFFYGGLSLAIVFSTMVKMPSTGLLNFLFGSILTVTMTDIYSIGAVAIAVGIIMKFVYHSFFDEEIARTVGINVNRVNMIFAVLTALVVVMGMTVVGLLLISALMIVPVASAHLWKRGFKATWGIATVYSVLSVIGGLCSAFWLDFAPGGTIVLTAIGLYVITFFVTMVQGK